MLVKDSSHFSFQLPMFFSCFVYSIAKCKTPSLKEQLVWKVARATSAAPTYFHSFESFLDGALFANNPTIDAMTEIYEYNMAMYSAGYGCKMGSTMKCVVSLGTGHSPTTKTDIVDFQYSISKDPTELHNTVMGLYKTGNSTFFFR